MQTGFVTPPVVHLLGAGALGRLWAAYLSTAAGIHYLPRPGTDPTPLRFSLRDATLPDLPSREVILAASGHEPLRVVLVMTKSADTLPALEALRPRLTPDTTLVLFQNGMGSQQAVAERFCDHAVLAAVTTEGANRPDASTVVHAGRGVTRVGALSKRGESRLASVISLLALSGLTVEASPDIRADLWRKLAINAMINPFTALLDCPNGQILSHPFFVSRQSALSEEIASVATAEGVALEAAQVLALANAVANRTAGNISSMLQDIRAGRQTEIDHINGYIAQAGERLHLPCPINQTLTERVRARQKGLAWDID